MAMPTMGADRATQSETGHSSIERRGLLAAAWAAVAGFVLKHTTEPLEAGVDGDVVLGASNIAATQTGIFRTATTGTALQVACTAAGGTASGLISTGSGYGVVAYKNGSGGGAGVFGQAETPESSGIYGLGFSANGVQGVSNTASGVFGVSGSGNAVLGQISGGSNTIAIYGVNNSTYAGASPGAGGFGVYGLSAKGHGLVGATASPGGAAVVGATNGVAGAWAGAFYGRVIVGGDFLVVGGAKSAAVPHPDGSHRLLYCVESPESWFEDFGKGQLECGQADVAIDPDFAAVADTRDYHVFLTQYDQHNDLCVTGLTPAGFRVQARNAGTDAKFSWRVVARRKDIAAARLAPVTIPSEPVLPPVPDVRPPLDGRPPRPMVLRS
jgi:hypothetical protein